MKVIIIVIAIVIAAGIVTVLAACGSQRKDYGGAIKEINARAAFDLILSNAGSAGFGIIDVRTPEEYQGGHIANATNINWNGPDFRGVVGALDKNRKYLVYCRSGHRTRGASQAMAEMGFSDIYVLDGGLNAWNAAGLPLTN